MPKALEEYAMLQVPGGVQAAKDSGALHFVCVFPGG